MIRKKLSYSLKNEVLAENVYASNHTLLLEKGKRLTTSDIIRLINVDIDSIYVEEQQKNIAIEVVSQVRTLWSQEDKVFTEMYVQNLDQIKNLFTQIAEDKDISLQSYLNGYSSMLESVLEHTSMLHTLHKIKGHDDYTYRHSLNVSLLCGVIGKLLSLSLEEIWILGQCGLLHDVGKIKIPMNILQKRARLTNEEFKQMKQHSLLGYKILCNIEGIERHLREAAHYHHERLDGSGYPEGRRGDEIPFYAQIVAVADTYDALCSDRYYNRRISPYQAVRELLESSFKNQLNANIVVPFVQFMLSGYAGYSVVLTDKTCGKIVFIPPDEPDRPLIQTDTGYVDLRQHRSLEIAEIM